MTSQTEEVYKANVRLSLITTAHVSVCIHGVCDITTAHVSVCIHGVCDITTAHVSVCIHGVCDVSINIQYTVSIQAEQIMKKIEKEEVYKEALVIVTLQ